MNAKISVVVPVYKVEEYLPRCLRSLLEQTIFEQIEVLLVDDGSPDACGRLCDEFAAGRDNVRVIHKVNGGLSDARNAGMDAATGDYFLFLDSDDFLRPDACEFLRDRAVESGADIVVYQLQEVYSDEGPLLQPAFAPFRIEGNRTLFSALANRDRGMTEIVCDKLFRRALFDGLRFPVGVKCEDAFTIPTIVSRAQAALVTGEKLYFYRQRPGSIMHTRGDSMVDDRVAAHEEIVRMARRQYPESLEAAKARTYHIRIVCLNAILDCPRFRTHPSWKRHIRELRERLPDLLRTKHAFWLPKRRKAYAILLCVCPDLALVYERIRFRERRRHLVYRQEKNA
ncbi:MAG TPA: glycosyltransferase family 2 protein [Candidatus Pullichristensenella avicola]|nr:glycosyltransferase family 2 protein [Candidatus Pullichristensenella avicola]